MMILCFPSEALEHLWLIHYEARGSHSLILLYLFVLCLCCVCVQFVRHHSRSEQCAAASHEPVRPDQHGGSSFSLHHLHAHRNQVRIRLLFAAA